MGMPPPLAAAISPRRRFDAIDTLLLFHYYYFAIIERHRRHAIAGFVSPLPAIAAIISFHIFASPLLSPFIDAFAGCLRHAVLLLLLRCLPLLLMPLLIWSLRAMPDSRQTYADFATLAFSPLRLPLMHYCRFRCQPGGCFATPGWCHWFSRHFIFFYATATYFRYCHFATPPRHSIFAFRCSLPLRFHFRWFIDFFIFSFHPLFIIAIISRWRHYCFTFFIISTLIDAIITLLPLSLPISALPLFFDIFIIFISYYYSHAITIFIFAW